MIAVEVANRLLSLLKQLPTFPLSGEGEIENLNRSV